MKDLMDEALQAFITESRDLLQSMEAALLHIEQDPDDAETINAIFRAAHTIKGSAGIFGLNEIVVFTHVAENLLDHVRKGHIRFDAALANLFLAVSDHIHTLVELIVRNTPADDDCQKRGAELVRRMESVQGSTAVDDGSLPQEPAPTQGTDTHNWHISLRFGANTIRDGFDPLSFVLPQHPGQGRAHHHRHRQHPDVVATGAGRLSSGF